MRKYYFIFLLLGLFTGMITSCSDDDEKYIPTPPEVSIQNLSGSNTCLPGETIELKAKLNSLLPTTFSWQLNKKEVSVDSIYRFTPADFGTFEIILTATNLDGVDSDTLSIEVTDGNLRFVSIQNLSGSNTCLPGETIELKAKVNNSLPTTFSWQLDKKEVSVDAIYRFTPADFGTFEIILTATNLDGVDSDTLSIEVTDGKFRFTSIKNWTGEGENLSALTIQWVTGTNLLEPADDEVFFLAWGYRWKNVESPTGIDMLKAVAKSDPRLYIILAEQWGGVTVKGFGYDGDNDGKIEVKNATLHLTEADFVDGVYMQVEGTDIDEIKPVGTGDYWIGGWYKAYASYWLGYGGIIPESDDFEYSNTVVSGRDLENNSWDAWTFSPIDPTSMGNTYPISRLIRAAEANK